MPAGDVSGELKIAVTASRPESDWLASEICRQAELAESLGYHSFWVPENHFTDHRAIPSPLTLLAAVAGRTREIKLATTSYLLPIRHPIQAAEEVAVLDQLCAGRLILGVGRGIQSTVFDVFDSPAKEKRARFKHNLEIMRAAWRGEPLASNTDGEPVQLAPLPCQQPHPPIWVAAFGKLALQQAGSLGLPYLASPMESLDQLEKNYAQYRLAVSSHGHAPQSTVPVMRTIFISENPAVVDRVRDAVQNSRLVPERVRQQPLENWAIIGDRSYAADRLSEYVERLGITHLIGGGRLPKLDAGVELRSLEALATVGNQLKTAPLKQ